MPDTITLDSFTGDSAEAPAVSALLLQGGTRSVENSDIRGAAPSAARHFAEGSPMSVLPMQLDVTIPVPRFRVQDLLALEENAILESRWPHADDLPIWCGGVQLVWSEFEVIEEKLAVRITRLA